MNHKKTVTKTTNTVQPIKKKNVIPPSKLTITNKRTKPTTLISTNKKASKRKEVPTTPQSINGKKLPTTQEPLKSKESLKLPIVKSKKLPIVKRNTQDTIDRRKAIVKHPPTRGDIKKRPLIQRVPLAIKEDVKVSKPSKIACLDELLPKEYPQNTQYFTNSLSYLEEITKEFPNFVVMHTWRRLCLNALKKRLTGVAKKLFTDFSLSIKEISNKTNIEEIIIVKNVLNAINTVSYPENKTIVDKAMCKILLEDIVKNVDIVKNMEKYFTNLFTYVIKSN